MSLFDLPLSELEKYKPDVQAPADFDAFWESTIGQTRKAAKSPRFDAVDTGLSGIRVWDVGFSGYAGQTVKGWFVLPADALVPRDASGKPKKLPCVVEFIGYGGGRGLPHQWLLWPNAGYACFVMDTRGQGSNWQPGDTPDYEPDGGNPHFPGFMTRGVLDPQTYYYRRVFSDAVRAVETAIVRPEVDPAKVIVTGGSQGGGISLAVAGLFGGPAALPDFALAGGMFDVPFLCHFRRATEITDSAPYSEIGAYLKTHRDKIDRVFSTLAYFDGLHFATRAKAAARFSVALMDDICPPSTVYAARNRYKGASEIATYTYNKHEGGGLFNEREKIAFAKKTLGC
jgi:cephalosporin-C deacetylase